MEDAVGVNSKLLRKIAKWIEKKPHAYDQKHWFNKGDDTDADRVTLKQVRKGKFECGATACVAGFAVVLTDEGLKQFADEDDKIDIRATAMNLLRLDYEQAGWLFTAARNEAAMPVVLRALADGETDLDELCQLEYDNAK